MEQDLVPELKAKLKSIQERKNQIPNGPARPTQQRSRFLCADQQKPDALGERLKPRTSEELQGHAYAFEVHWVEQAIIHLEFLSGRQRTIPLVAGMAMDQALLALYKAKGAFDAFQKEER